MKVVKTRNGIIVSFLFMISFLILLFFLSINVGSLKIGFMQMLQGLFVEYDEAVATVYDLRFPRIIIAMIAGASIAVSGVLFQAVMKNPLADPGIIGISSGASLMAVLVILFFPALYFFTPFFAFLGGIFACILVYSLAWKGGLSPLRMILVGIAINAMLMGIMQGLNAMSGGDVQGSAAIVNGNISMKTWSDVQTIALYSLFGLIGACLCSERCNLLALEDKTAHSIGIDVQKERIIISVIAVLLISISTAIVGVVGFLGLIAPHICRLLIGSNHKLLIPFSIVVGACILLGADTAGRVMAAPYEISASILMSVVGGPVFILLLKRSKTNYGN